jgi:uncharacterized protein (DUF433 family)
MNDAITIDPEVCNGRPCVRGKRIAVQSVLEFLAAGDSVDEILQSYPVLTRDDVQACLDFASRLMARNYTVVSAA